MMAEFINQPKGGERIDTASTFVKGLVYSGRAVGSSWIDGIQPRITNSGSGGAVGASGKFGANSCFLNTSNRIFCMDNGSILPTADCTIMVIYEKRDTTLRTGRIFCQQQNTVAQLLAAHGPYSDGNIYFDYGGQTNGVTRLTVSGQTWSPFVPSVWFFTVGVRGMECWRDGIRIGSNGGRPTRSQTVSSWNLGGGSVDPSDLVDYYATNIWTRQLSQAEIMTLSKLPWSMYRQQTALFLRKSAGVQRRKYVLVY